MNNQTYPIIKTNKGQQQRHESVKKLSWLKASHEPEFETEDPNNDLPKTSKKASKEQKRVERIKQRREARRKIKEVAKVVIASKLNPTVNDRTIGEKSNSKKKKLSQKEEPTSPPKNIYDFPIIPTIDTWKQDVKLRKIRPFIIDQIASGQPGEYLMMSGRTGIGKTNLALCLAYCLATGTEFYGHKCRQTKVAYLAFEGGIANYQDRIAKIEKLFPSVEERLHFDVIPPNDPLTLYAETMAKLSMLEDCKVVILDGSYRLVNGDPSKTSDAKTFCLQLQSNLVELGMYGVLTVQITKPNRNSLVQLLDTYSMQGAAGFADKSETVILLEKQMRKDNEFRLHVAKSRVAVECVDPVDLIFHYDQCHFEMDHVKEFVKSVSTTMPSTPKTRNK